MHGLVRAGAAALALATCYWSLLVAGGPEPATELDVTLAHVAHESSRLYEAGRFADALAPTLSLVRMYPEGASYLERLAVIYGKLNRAKDEADSWERFVVVSPTPFEACPQIGLAYQRLGQTKQMADAFDRCLAFDPTNPDLMFFAALGAEQTDRRERAKMLYADTLAVASWYVDAQIGLARMRLHDGDLAGARTLALAALRAEPRAVDALLVLGMAFQRDGDRAEARRYFTRGLAVQENYPDLHLGLGMVEEADGRIDAARQEYLRALAIDPARSDVRDQLSRLEARAK